MKYRDIGNNKPCFIIAEAGVNHNGDIKVAKKLVDVAKYSGVDAVKFQTFKSENIIVPGTKKANYQKRAEEKTQYEMLKKLELKQEEFIELKSYCDEKEIEFISTPYDVESIDFLNKLKVNRYKVASADIVNKELLEAIAKTKKQVILSTGMATIKEVKRAFLIINKSGNNNVVLLHCTTMYPTSYENVNMNFLKTLKETFDIPVGYSDHTIGIQIPIMAVSLGATVLEKHLTLDRNMKGPDHFASLTSEEMKNMVESIRYVEKAFGKKNKTMTDEENKNMLIMRRSIHSSNNIKKGETITRNSLKITRPNDGIEAWSIDKVIGSKALKEIKKDSPIKWSDIK